MRPRHYKTPARNADNTAILVSLILGCQLLFFWILK
jgi:hypothetical protein